MNALVVIIAKLLVALITAGVAGLAIYAVMRFADTPRGRVLSWPKRVEPKADDPYVSRSTLERLRDPANGARR